MLPLLLGEGGRGEHGCLSVLGTLTRPPGQLAVGIDSTSPTANSGLL